jgi:hypothetical protein
MYSLVNAVVIVFTFICDEIFITFFVKIKIYRPFSNLTTKWVPNSVFSNLIWVICIDKDLDGAEHCFPMVLMEAHAAYGNKIAQGVIHKNIWGVGEVVVKKATLTETEARDLDEHISPVCYDRRDTIFHEATQAIDSDVEDLI